MTVNLKRHAAWLSIAPFLLLAACGEPTSDQPQQQGSVSPTEQATPPTTTAETEPQPGTEQTSQ